MSSAEKRRRGIDTNIGQAGYCAHCRRHMPRGPDACIGYLPGVIHACCGHGRSEDAYVVVAPGYDPGESVFDIPEDRHLTVYGDEAVTLLEYLTAQDQSR